MKKNITTRKAIALLACMLTFPAGLAVGFAADTVGGNAATQQIATATQTDAQQLVKQLSSHDAHIVMEAAYQLARLGDTSVVRDLVALLRSDSGMTREYALIALGGIRDPRTIGAIRLELDDPMSNVSSAAQNALKKFGKEAEPTLLLALTDKNPRAAWKASMLLAMIGNNAGADHLLSAVAKGSPGERMEALKLLAMLGDSRALLPLIDALVDREPDVAKKVPVSLDQLLRIRPELCAEALKVLREKTDPLLESRIMGILADVNEPRAIPVFAELAGHADPVVRQGAVAALGAIGAREHSDLVRKALHDCDASVRFTAITALGCLGDTDAVLPLAAIVKTGAVEVARAAIASLVKIGPASVAPLLELVKGSDLQVRSLAVGALGDLHAAVAADAMLAAVQEKSSVLRTAAISAMGRIGDPRVVPVLIGLLGEEDPLAVEAAGMALAEIGNPAVQDLLAAYHRQQPGVTTEVCAQVLSQAVGENLAPLNDLWKSGRPEDRRVVLLAAEKLGEERGSALVLQALQKEVDPALRVEALRILGVFAPEDTTPLLAALEDPAPEVAAAAAETLGSMDAHESVAPLLGLLVRDNVVTRKAALEALGAMAASAAAPAIIPLLNDTNPVIRVAGANALGEIRDQASAAELAKLLSRDSNAAVRAAAAEALCNIDAPASVDALKGLLVSDDACLRQIALEGIGRRGGAAEVASLLAASHDGNRMTQSKALIAAAQTLRRGGCDEHTLTDSQVAEVAALLKNPDASTRNQASQLLEHVGRQAIPAVAKLTGRSEAKTTRTAAIATLGAIRSRAATDLLVALLTTDPDTNIQCITIIALGRIRDPNALTPVVRMLNSPDHNVRADAAFALGWMKDSRAVGALMKASNDEDVIVRKKAREGLLRLTGNKCPIITVFSPYPFVEPGIFAVMIFLLVLPLVRKWIPPFDAFAKRIGAKIAFTERGQFWLAVTLGVMGLSLFSYSIYCQVTQPGLEQFVRGFLTNLFLFSMKTFPFFVGGCLISGLVMKYFTKRWHLPRSMTGACILGAILPLCSCGVVPLTRAMMSMNIPRRTVIAFLVVTPILNPFVIVLSYGVIGFWYTFLRIFGTFLVAVLMGLIIERFVKPDPVDESAPICGFCKSCVSKDQPKSLSGLINGLHLMGYLHRYIIIGVILGSLMAAYLPMTLVTRYLGNDFWGLIVAVTIGVPLYLCTGEEVIFLKPLLDMGLPMGHAIAFTLAGNGICITSIAVLIGVLGRRTTIVLTGLFFVLPFLLGYAINLFFR